MFRNARRWVRRWITDIRPVYAMGGAVAPAPDPTKTTSVALHPKVFVPLIVGAIVSVIGALAASKGYQLPDQGNAWLTGVLMAIAGYIAPNAP